VTVPQKKGLPLGAVLAVAYDWPGPEKGPGRGCWGAGMSDSAQTVNSHAFPSELS